jgi:hypothetical protein
MRRCWSSPAGEPLRAWWHELCLTAGVLWDLLEWEGTHRAGPSTCATKPRGRGGRWCMYRRKNSNERWLEWTLGKGNTVWGRALGVEGLV